MLYQAVEQCRAAVQQPAHKLGVARADCHHGRVVVTKLVHNHIVEKVLQHARKQGRVQQG